MEARVQACKRALEEPAEMGELMMDRKGVGKQVGGYAVCPLIATRVSIFSWSEKN